MDVEARAERLLTELLAMELPPAVLALVRSARRELRRRRNTTRQSSS